MQFQVGGGLTWGWLCSTMLALCDVRVCVGRYTFGIENRELCMKRLNGPISSNCGTGDARVHVGCPDYGDMTT